MVVEWLTAAGAGAAGAVMNIFQYNRSAWIVDAQMKQHRRVQKQSVILSQAGMFREDISEIVEAATVRQSNFILVLTLILGMVSVCYTFASFPEATPGFLETAFTLCAGSALLYLVAAVLFAMASNQLANRCQRDMLTMLARLPIMDLASELQNASAEDSVDAFEDQSPSTMLRVPGVSRMCDKQDASGSAWLQTMQARRRTYMDVFRKKEHEWNMLGMYALIYGALGTGDLLQGYAYLSASQFYSSNELVNRAWCAGLVQSLLTMVDVVLQIGLSEYMGLSKERCINEVLMVMGGQFFTFLAMRSDNMLLCRSFVVLCISCNIMRNLLGHFALQERPKEAAQTFSSPVGRPGGSRSPCSEDNYMIQQDEAKMKKEKKRDGAARLGTGVVMLMWVLTLGWALFGDVIGHQLPVQERRLEDLATLQRLAAQLEEELEAERRWNGMLEAQTRGLEAALHEGSTSWERDLQNLTDELGEAVVRAVRTAAPVLGGEATSADSPVPAPALHEEV